MDDLDDVNAFFLEAFAPQHRADPYPLYARIRGDSEMLSAAAQMHLAFGFDTCWSLLRSPQASSDERRSSVVRRESQHDPRLAQFLDTRPLLVFMDPPDHTRLRALVAQGFTPRRVERLRLDVERRTATLVRDLAANGGEVDLIEHLAYPLPIGIIGDLLGLPADDHALLRDWSRALVKSVDPAVLRTDAENTTIAEATAALQAYAAEQLAYRRRHPGDDLLSDLAPHLSDTDDGAGGNAGELVDLVLLLLVAGHETTVNLIGNGIVALLDHPDQLARWHRDPGLGAGAVEELLRFDVPLQFDAPLQMVQRVAITDLDVGGRTISAGDQVIVLLGSANRDPSVFDQPDRLDLQRPNAHRHLAFGGGIHHCLGAALARLEGLVALGALVEQFPAMERCGPSPVRDTFTLRGRSVVPVDLGRYGGR